MSSSMAERWLVKPMVESSNLSSSAKCECGEAGESQQSVKLLPSGLASSILATHTMERVRLVEDAVLKTVSPKGSGVRFPLSPQD